MNIRVLLAAVAIACSAATSQAAVPDTLGYQGRLTQNGIAVNGTVSIAFSLYASPTGGSALWTETKSVNVASGLYSVILGKTNSFPAGLFTQPLYVGVKVGSDAEMAPRQELSSTPYSQQAKKADTATGLATTPTLCPSGQFSQGVDASGNATGCATALPTGGNWPLSSNLNISGSGNLTINPGTLNFGSTPMRQMVNLWNGEYGVGVQSWTQYQRSAGGFAWFNGGTHADNTFDPGSGGTNLMWLDSGGSLFTKGGLTIDTVDANNGAYTPGLAFGGNGSGEAIASQRGANGNNRFGLDFYTAGLPRLAVNFAGDVGIGTTSPTSKLTVNGPIESTKGGLKFPDGSTQTTASPTNRPGVQFSVPALFNLDPSNWWYSSLHADEVATTRTISVAVPANGYLVVSGSAIAQTFSQFGFIQLFDETAGEMFASTILAHSPELGTFTVHGVLPVTAGVRVISLKLKAGLAPAGNGVALTYIAPEDGTLIATYFPVRY